MTDKISILSNMLNNRTIQISGLIIPPTEMSVDIGGQTFSYTLKLEYNALLKENQDLKAKLNMINIDKILKENDDLKKLVEELRRENSELKETIKKLESDINDLKLNNEKLEVSNKSLSDRITIMEQKEKERIIVMTTAEVCKAYEAELVKEVFGKYKNNITIYNLLDNDDDIELSDKQKEVCEKVKNNLVKQYGSIKNFKQMLKNFKQMRNSMAHYDFLDPNMTIAEVHTTLDEYIKLATKNITNENYIQSYTNFSIEMINTIQFNRGDKPFDY